VFAVHEIITKQSPAFVDPDVPASTNQEQPDTPTNTTVDPDAALKDELRQAKADADQAKARLEELRRRKRLADLERSKARRALLDAPKPQKDTVAPEQPVEGALYAYGAAAIGKITNQKPSSVYYWFKRGLFGDAVWNPGGKTLVGSVAKLRTLGPR
jgi:hypothetical protein